MKKQEQLLMTIVIIIAISILIIAGAEKIKEKNNRISVQNGYSKSYDVIIVEKGDTLTSIVNNIFPEEQDLERYKTKKDLIDEIRFMNNLTGDRIKEGQLLAVPIYEKKGTKAISLRACTRRGNFQIRRIKL